MSQGRSPFPEKAHALWFLLVTQLYHVYLKIQPLDHYVTTGNGPRIEYTTVLSFCPSESYIGKIWILLTACIFFRVFQWLYGFLSMFSHFLSQGSYKVLNLKTGFLGLKVLNFNPKSLKILNFLQGLYFVMQVINWKKNLFSYG